MSTSALTAAWLGILLTTGCVRNPGMVEGIPRPFHVALSTDVLREDEIQSINAMNAYEAVERLRPAVLRRALSRSPLDRRDVYLDGVRLGTVEQLRGIPATDVHEVRYLTTAEATGRYGNVAPGGMILVTTKTGWPRQ